ncbi:hypothetical protein FB384_002051 [Prauserella sediminis]|uniref:Uncharacterized protein n=1 Tax=Prauserella sediminis TaxID=577680 RepID=A0A839XKP3_9PSEU|nr:hypothetical protein [Prauserella sediminis]
MIDAPAMRDVRGGDAPRTVGHGSDSPVDPFTVR